MRARMHGMRSLHRIQAAMRGRFRHSGRPPSERSHGRCESSRNLRGIAAGVGRGGVWRRWRAEGAFVYREPAAGLLICHCRDRAGEHRRRLLHGNRNGPGRECADILYRWWRGPRSLPDYRGRCAFQGQYVFADFIIPNVWSIPAAGVTQGVTLPSTEFVIRNADVASNAGRFDNIASFGVDAASNLYLIDLDGEIFVIEPVPTVANARAQRSMRRSGESGAWRAIR